MIERRRSIRSFALVCTAASSAFSIGLSLWLVWLLSSQDWCARAIGAAKYVEGRPEFAVGGCYKLQTLQVEALARALHISVGIQALCLLVLIVIVVAGGRLYFKASEHGVETNIGRDEAARAVADAAEDKAEEITGGDPPP